MLLFQRMCSAGTPDRLRNQVSWLRKKDLPPDTLSSMEIFKLRRLRGVGAVRRNPEHSRGNPANIWRRERDLNPRYPFGYSGFQDRPFQPLTHPSAAKNSLAAET